jgi:pyruvate ferredoxin oxidoreductase alpha subunit
MEIRKELHDDLIASLKTIREEYDKYQKIIKIPTAKHPAESLVDNGLIEYYGPRRAKTVIIAMGSVVGTIKDVIDEKKTSSSLFAAGAGVLKIKSFRPFPAEEILKVLKSVGAKNIAVAEKAISLGNAGPLYIEIKAAIQNKMPAIVKNYVIGLGGRDITKEMVRTIISKAATSAKEIEFIGK